MSQAIQFLEMVGRSPVHLFGSGDYDSAIDALVDDDAQRVALRARDGGSLGELLGGRVRMVCQVCTPDGGEPDSVPGDDQDGDGVPDDQDPAPKGE